MFRRPGAGDAPFFSAEPRRLVVRGARRGRVWYAQVFNPATKKYLPGKPTGESDRRAAEHVVDDWLRDGMPEPGGRQRRPSAEVFEISAILQAIRKAPLTPPDAERIVRALKDQELIETVVLKAGPGSEGLVAFLNRFWNYENSWADERSRLGNILAMCTGLRAGEILAIQVRDLGEDRLRVRHSWSLLDGLKGTKTGKERIVPLIPSVCNSLLEPISQEPLRWAWCTFGRYEAGSISTGRARPSQPENLA
jgi:integrase